MNENDKTSKIPITVVSGYLGSGKTSLILHLLKCKEQRRFGIIVNDVAEVNVDAKIIEQSPFFTAADQLIPLQSGSISGSLKEELIESVTLLAKSQTVDYILIESSGIAQPDLIEKYIRNGLTRHNEKLSDFSRVDTLVSVVDSYRLLQQFMPETGKFNDDFQISNQVIMNQIESCDVILFNKIDLVTAKDKQYVLSLVKQIHPDVEIVESTYCQIPIQKVLETHLSTREKGLERFKKDSKISRALEEEFEVETFVYRRRAPFHPERFDAWLDNWPKEIIRCKGVVWFVTQPNNVIHISQAGRAMDIAHSGYWIASLKQWEIEKLMTIRENLKEIWDAEYGDRMIELVFIGSGVNQTEITDELDHCLFKRGEDGLNLNDPFKGTEARD